MGYRHKTTGYSPAFRYRRHQENPSSSPRIGRAPPRGRFWGRERTWYPFRGYPRVITIRRRPTGPAPSPPAASPIRRVATATIFTLFPLLLFPLFIRLNSLIYPGLRLFGGMVRPPAPRNFFHEMWILILATVTVVILQTVFALLFLRRPRSAGGSERPPWGEASMVGGLLSLGVYGVLRGFQISPADQLFFPAPALGAAIFCWLLISGTILFPGLTRK